MGYSKNTWFYLNKYFKKSNLLLGENLPSFGIKRNQEPYYNKEILELGCQTFRGSIRKEMNSHSVRHSAKKYFNSIGIICLTVDIKECLESLKIDITKPIDSFFHNKFDIVINSGTTEHISSKEGQYQTFKNIHSCCKVEGIMLHFVPDFIRERKKHGYFNYSDIFFKNLSELNNYKIIDIERYDRKEGDFYWGTCFKKIENNKFTTEKEKFYKYLK